MMISAIAAVGSANQSTLGSPTEASSLLTMPKSKLNISRKTAA